MSLIVDASVALKWFLSEEPHADRALAVVQDGIPLIAPDLIIAEVCNAAWRSARLGRISSAQVDEIASSLPRFFDGLVGAAALAPRAVAIAGQLDHPVSDGLYVARAEAEQAVLVTADAQLLGKVRATPWERFAEHHRQLPPLGIRAHPAPAYPERRARWRGQRLHRAFADDARSAQRRAGLGRTRHRQIASNGQMSAGFAAELNRPKGQLLLRQGHSEAAEELYRKALGIAREQEAKLWELRASMSLARLRHDQGRRAEARDLLAPVYGWFTEGFGTPDLKEAKALLDELGRV